MRTNLTTIDYRSTGLFSNLVNDYIEGKGTAADFVAYPPSIEGIRQAIEARKKFPINRTVLKEVLTNQYANFSVSKAVQAQLDSLENENTFVITTAHQQNIFSGPLYFFYKILHAIELADALKKLFPENHFVPVYYMGSEDADLQEIGNFTIEGNSNQWVTPQKGAFGRMLVDDALLSLLNNLEGYWAVQPAGKEALTVLKEAYQLGRTINEATMHFVNAYFGSYGLVVLQPDDRLLKKQFIAIAEKELTTQFSNKVLQPTIEALSKTYAIQTEGRPINLFYLKDHLRARIEKKGEKFIIVDTDIEFSLAAILEELHQFPERFSPNVILRGVYQESILPGIVFIGGGGELAYWMELKNIFEAAGVHYPVLQLRNSFLFIPEKPASHWSNLGLSWQDLFKPIENVVLSYIQKNTNTTLHLTKETATLTAVYEDIQKLVEKIDPTLVAHTQNLLQQAKHKITALEKKMLRAVKRKEVFSVNRMEVVKKELFPNENLQERVEHFSKWVGRYGWDWVTLVKENSKPSSSFLTADRTAIVAPKFTIITIENEPNQKSTN